MIVLDCETTTWNKGHVYDPRNSLVVAGFLSDSGYRELWTADYHAIDEKAIYTGDIVVGFNLKFDLNWIRRTFGIFPFQQVWDCQLAEYIYSGQTLLYPSLNECCERYGLPQKLDVVKTEYWDKGIDTRDIPRAVLSEYLEQDVRLTAALYEKQKDHPQARLVRQMCWDLLCISEMEFNGMRYDREGSLKAADELRTVIDDVHKRLDAELGATLNWQSPKQVAAVLFGGVVEYEDREEYLFTYADKKKPPVMKTRKVIREVVFPQLTPSLKKTDSGADSVDDEVLNKIPRKGKAGRIVALLKEKSAIAKLEGTYYRGIPKKFDEYGWTEFVHGSINQTAVVTGRTSSNNPNLQNIPLEGKQFFISRFQ